MPIISETPLVCWRQSDFRWNLLVKWASKKEGLGICFTLERWESVHLHLLVSWHFIKMPFVEIWFWFDTVHYKSPSFSNLQLTVPILTSNTPWKFNSSPLKMDHPKWKVLFQAALFQRQAIKLRGVYSKLWNLKKSVWSGSGISAVSRFLFCWWQPEIRVKRHQLRLVVNIPVFPKVLYIPGGFLAGWPDRVSTGPVNA